MEFYVGERKELKLNINCKISAYRTILGKRKFEINTCMYKH